MRIVHARSENSMPVEKLLECVAVIALLFATGKEYVMVDKEMKDILHSIFSYFTDNKTSKVIVCPTENASRLSRDKLQHVERNFGGCMIKLQHWDLENEIHVGYETAVLPQH